VRNENHGLVVDNLDALKQGHNDHVDQSYESQWFCFGDEMSDILVVDARY
jgi:hypothetical protein